MAKCYYCDSCKGGCSECRKKTEAKAEVPSPNEPVTLIEAGKKPAARKLYGFVSQKCSASGLVGTFLYSCPDGSHVVVNWVDSNQDNTSLWDDAVCIGEVEKYVKGGKPFP